MLVRAAEALDQLKRHAATAGAPAVPGAHPGGTSTYVGEAPMHAFLLRPRSRQGSRWCPPAMPNDRKVFGIYFLDTLLSLTFGTPCTLVRANSGLSESCPKTATYRSPRFFHLAALVPSAGTILNLKIDRGLCCGCRRHQHIGGCATPVARMPNSFANSRKETP